MPAHRNALAHESSPYLLQHAGNPVDWHAWNDAAFDLARRRDVPVFLSIGYSTCYWCHVMERESFESETIARTLNELFVCIKVDREERPDVDDIYMTALQLARGQGGWPLNACLDPETRAPFWIGTYFPPEPRAGMASLTQIAAAISDAWTSRRADVLSQGRQLADAVREHISAPATPCDLGAAQVSQAVGSLLRIVDRTHGGFGGAPKFPQPVFLDLLLDVRTRAADDATADAIDAALTRTLNAMMIGGIRDHLGGGFHRYSVDAEWTVPHFEKMLYDNAQLASTYARAAALYADPAYADTARAILADVGREMTGPDGGFFSAIDAEVDHREGLNYLWTVEQLRDVLADDAGLAIQIFGLDRGPNFRDPHHPDDPPANVLRLANRLDRLAPALGMSADDLSARVRSIAVRLYSARCARPRPHTDDKILAGWNGLMISALAECALAFNDRAHLDHAARAARFILANLRTPSGGLLRTWRHGVAKVPAFLEDYAALVAGLVAITRAARVLAAPPAAPAHAEAPSDPGAEFLAPARELARIALSAFADPGGRLFDTLPDQPDLFVRTSSTHDGAVPSGSSLFIHALIDLHEATSEPAWLDHALGALRAMSAAIAENPLATANATRALFRLLTHSEAAAARLAPGGMPAALPNAAEPGEFTPVAIYTNVERVSVGPDHPASIRLVVRIAPGYHVPAADPGPNGRSLTPFRISVASGVGLAAYADYPAGTPFTPGGAPGADPAPLMYSGDLEFDVALEQTGPRSGRPLLVASFQPCSNDACLAPMLVELDIAIDQA